MEEFLFTPFKVTDKRVELKDYNINSYNLLEFLFLSSTPKKIAQIFNELMDEKVIKIEEDQEYEVEAILDEADEDGEKQYLVKWKNWHIEFCTWEPKENLINCEDEFIQYEKRKLENRKGGFVIDYAQPKLELISQILSVITECHVEPSHVYKYLPTPSNNKSLRRKKTSHISIQNTKRTKIVMTTIKKALSDWEDLINQTYPLFKVTVENTVDKEGPPLDFQFITDYVSSNGIEIHSNPPIGCHCESSCLENKKDCSFIHGGDPPYTITGKVIPRVGVPVYECNSACTCDINCRYRVVQRGVKLQLKIFRTVNRGWGLKTLTKIVKGNFIMEYLGEIVTVDEAEERGKLYDQQNLTYLFDLDFAGDPEFTVDAYKKGNMSHFINHSCNPNMTSRCVFINNLDIRMPRIAFYADRDIRSGEELTFDYMMTGAISENKENEGSVVSTSTSSINVNTKYEAASESASSTQVTGRVPCLCDAANCRKYLY